MVRAESAADVSAVLRVCSELKIPVTPRGCGTGVTGGALAVAGGVVLSMERMNRILEIDTGNMTAVVEPGAVTGEIQKAARARGLMYPPDPASLETCSIGGNVSENAGGPRAVKYGVTRDYILGLEFVLPDGRVVETGGKTVKNVMGYNLTGIIIGSEGTLAVITKIYLRLIPAPPVSMDMLIPFPGLAEAIDSIYRITQSRIVPAAIEFMEEGALRLVSRHLQGTMLFPEAGAHLLIQVDGASREDVFRDIEGIAVAVSVPEENIILADSAFDRERIWKARRSIREAINLESPVFLAEDCSVPRSMIPQFLKSVKAHCDSRGLSSVMFGHAGDGNVHIDILKGDMPHDVWRAMLPGLKREIYVRALDLGGAISGEHGIGYLRREFLPMGLSDAAIDLHRRIKDAFDPDGILNPHKVLPERSG